MSFRDKWGYKGTETSINGLTKWLEKYFDRYGSAQDRWNAQCRLIIEYGKANIPNYVKRGTLDGAATYVAKYINRNKLFSHFTTWVENHFVNAQTKTNHEPR